MKAEFRPTFGCKSIVQNEFYLFVVTEINQFSNILLKQGKSKFH